MLPAPLIASALLSRRLFVGSGAGALLSAPLAAHASTSFTEALTDPRMAGFQPGVDEGLRGMREGGWRRLVVPDAYGQAGLRRQVPVRGGGRSQPPYAGYVVAPGAFAWFDVILVDAGSGRCDAVLRPEGVSEERTSRLRSLTCLPGEVSYEFNMGTG